MGKSMPDKVVAPTAFPPKAEVTVAPVSDGAPQSKPIITMYVRRGDEILMGALKIKTRTISLHPIPDKASLGDLLGIGFAIDGDAATLSVNQYTEVDDLSNAFSEEEIANMRKDGKPCFFVASFADSVLQHNLYHEPWTLTDALHQVQVNVVGWLRGLGYDVKIA